MFDFLVTHSVRTTTAVLLTDSAEYEVGFYVNSNSALPICIHVDVGNSYYNTRSEVHRFYANQTPTIHTLVWEN